MEHVFVNTGKMPHLKKYQVLSWLCKINTGVCLENQIVWHSNNPKKELKLPDNTEGKFVLGCLNILVK